MQRDLGRLRVRAVIVHEIPHHRAGEPGEAVLSEVESPLQPEIRHFFQEKIVHSLGSAAYDVELNPDSTSPVPTLILEHLEGRGGSFVQMSQEMARHLYHCQGGLNPVGLFTAVEVSIGAVSALALLKLEKEEGARVRLIQAEGGTTLSVAHVRDLMLTGKTKVFKVGLFVQGGADLDGVEGQVCDTQKSYNATPAHFFLEQFLGCRLREAPEITTKRFFDAAESFINEKVEDPETKGRYQVALFAELGSGHDRLTPQAFATAALDVEHRQAFTDHLSETSVPVSAFPKDVNLVRSQLSRIHMSFESGVSVLAAPETIGHQVEITELDDGNTRVQVTDRLSAMRGRGPR